MTRIRQIKFTTIHYSGSLALVWFAVILGCRSSDDSPELTVQYPGLRVLSIAETSSSWWIGSDEGLIRIQKASGDTNGYTPLNSPLTTYTVSGLETDAQGALWITNGANGLLRYADDEWTTFPVDSGLPGGTIVDIKKTPTGLLLAAGGGIGTYDGTVFSIVEPPSPGFYGSSVTSVAQTENGDLWIGTWGGGLIQVTGTTWKKWTPSNSLIRTLFVFDIQLSPDGSVWIGEGGGLAHYQSGTWEQFNSLNSPLPQNDVTAIAARGSNEIWIGMYEGGLAVLDHGHWTSYRPTNSELPSDRIFRIFEDSRGHLWVGTPLGLVKIRL